jgi:hypothetical protein
MVDVTAAEQSPEPSSPETSGHTDAPTAATTDVASGSDDKVADSATTDTPETPSDAPGSDARPKRGRPRKGAGASSGVELVLTVTGTADAIDWQAEVTHGSKRVVKGLSIPASAVAAAAKDLHPDIAEAIEAVLSAARERQRSRVEQLQAELAAAQRALADLQGG